MIRAIIDANLSAFGCGLIYSLGFQLDFNPKSYQCGAVPGSILVGRTSGFRV